MKTTPITSTSLQLTRYGLVNCYLVREHGVSGAPDTFTLLDTGLAGSAPAILAAAQAAGAPIRRILLTHAHVDHVGAVDALLQQLATQGPPLQLAASARSLPLLRQPPDKRLEPGEPAGRIKGGLPGIRSRVTHVVAPGELYGSLRVLDTPGHIPGHLSFLDERDGTLFAGDALIGVRRLAISGFAPWYFPFPNLATWNRTVALASARKLLRYPIERIACGHGRIQPNTLEAAVNAASGDPSH